MIDYIAHIACPCGRIFQQILETVDPETGDITIDWNEAATAALYQAHVEVCDGNAENS